MLYCRAHTLILALFIAGCASKAPIKPAPKQESPPKVAGLISIGQLAGTHTPVGFDALPNWGSSDLKPLHAPLIANCQTIVKRPSLKAWQGFCAALQLEQDPRTAIEAHLQAYAQLDAQGNAMGLATGYYEPVLLASLERGGAYQWPLYAMPEAPSSLPRESLTPDDGSVHPSIQGRELAWLADPIDVYVVQVQGSTRLRLPSGEVVRLAFAGTNGQPFSSMASPLIQSGVFKASEASNERLKVWARGQSKETVQKALNTNARFVFFKRDATPEGVGPAGSLGVPLTPMNSIAVDPAYTPLGALVWLQTTVLPTPQLMLAQDTGSAIKGAARVDIYFGTGDAAGAAASKTKHLSQLWVLWPKE